MKLVTVPEMQAVEREANEQGLTYDKMMENAGQGLGNIIASEYDYLETKKVLGLVGSGNNGGDTLVALIYLEKRDWDATAYIVRPRPENDPLMQQLNEAGGRIVQHEKDVRMNQLGSLLGEHSVLLDGVLGTGIRLPLKPELGKVFLKVRSTISKLDTPPHVVAVDCPSGVDCDNGEAAPECIPAELTVTMAAVKSGLMRFPAANYTGELRVVNIGPVDDLPSWKQISAIVVDADIVLSILPKRPRDAHKGTFGTALVVAGSVNYTGAAVLAGEAAYRIGAGLVTLAVPSPLHAALSGQFPEATWVLLPHDMGVIAADASEVLRKKLANVTAMLVGPGFGLEETTCEFISRLIASDQQTHHGGMGFVRSTASNAAEEEVKLPPMVIDADGLKLLARLVDWQSKLPNQTILTPHPGEMAVISGLSRDEIQADRINIAARFAKEWGHILVLKGAFTIIADPDGKIAVIPVATPALARAGTGDVLAGLIVGLRAQGVDAFQAAMAGAWIHAQAGLLAAQQLGNTASVLAGDVLRAVPQVLSKLY